MAINMKEKDNVVPKDDENGSIAGLLIFCNIIAAVSLVLLYFLAKKKTTPHIKMDTIRNIYEGLAPDEME
jgi:hypothetical protein